MSYVKGRPQTHSVCICRVFQSVAVEAVVNDKSVAAVPVASGVGQTPEKQQGSLNVCCGVRIWNPYGISGI